MRDAATRWAQATVVVIFVVGVLLVAPVAYRDGFGPLGPEETTTTTKDIKESKTTAKGTESTEKREVTTASKETALERALGKPGLLLARLLLVVLVAFFSGAAVQRIILGEFSLKLGPVEVPPLPPAPPEPLSPVPEEVVAAFGPAAAEPGIPEVAPLEPGITSSSYVMSLLEHVHRQGPTDYAVIDVGTGNNWLTTRLYLFAILFRRMRELRTFVFVETLDGVEQRFMGVTAPDLVRWRLAREYPWLEVAYAHAYCAIQDYQIRSDTGSLEPFTAGRLVEEFMKRPEIQAMQQQPPGDDWVRLGPETWEHARWINRSLLDRLLDSAGAHVSVVDAGDLTGRARTLAILAREGNFVALVDERKRFRSLIDRRALLEAVANNLVAGAPQSPDT